MSTATGKKQKKKVITYARLKGLRAQSGESMADLARILGMSESTYISRENGKREFKVSEAKIICEHFNTSAEEIFFS